MHKLHSVDEGSLHPNILRDNIHDALGNPGCCNWAAGIHEQFASLGVPFLLSGGGICNVDHLAFRKAMLARDMSVWKGLEMSPRGAPSRGAKLCTYLWWFARPDRGNTEPYYELPLPVTKLNECCAQRRRRRKFTTPIQPTKAYKDESVMGLIDNGQHKSTNRLLVLVIHEGSHGISMPLLKALK